MLLTTEHDGEHGARLTCAARLLGQAGSIDEVVVILRDHTRDIVGSDGIAVILRDGDFCHYVAESAIEPLWRGQRFRLEECISGWAMLNRKTVVISDLEADPRVPQNAYSRTSMRSLAMVPIGTPDPAAALGAYWCAFVEPDNATVQQLEILAQVAALAFARLASAGISPSGNP